MTADRLRILTAGVLQSLNIPLAGVGVLRSFQGRFDEAWLLLLVSGLLFAAAFVVVRSHNGHRPRWNPQV